LSLPIKIPAKKNSQIVNPSGNASRYVFAKKQVVLDWLGIVRSLKNSTSLNFYIENSNKITASRYVFAKKQINSMWPWIVGSSKKFYLFEFLYRELEQDNHFSIIFAKKQINSKRLWIVCSSKKFCLFEFLYRELNQHNNFSIIFAKKQINSKRQCVELIQNLFYPKKIEKIPAKKIVNESNCQSLRQRTENPFCL
jgi:hypothetical protein